MNMEAHQRPLHDVCTIEKEQGNHFNLPYVGLENIESHTGHFNGSRAPHAVKSSSFRFSNQHVLYGRLRPYLNKAMAPDFEGHCSTEIFPLKPGPELSRGYLLYWLLSRQTCDQINSTATGTRMPRANMNEVMSLRIPVPALTVQTQIVRLLDEALEGIAIAKANAEQNLQNARALFESHLQFTFTKGGKGWAERPLIDLCSVFEDGDWIESRDQSSGGIRLIQTGNVGNGVFRDRAGKARFISESTFQTLRCTEIFSGDCLVSRLPDPVGRSCIIPSVPEKMITAVDCTILRFKTDVLIPEYFVYYSQSDSYLTSISKLCTGTTRNRISRTNLGLTSVPVPSLTKQREVVASLKQIERQTQALEASYTKKITALEEFSKSILRDAFAGTLKAA